MIKNIKAKNEEILKNHFEEVFGEGYTINVNWGFPFVVIEVHLENETNSTTTTINIDLVQEGNFALNIFGAKKVYEERDPESKEEPEAERKFRLEPDWTSIDSNTINFIGERVRLITEQFFTTREMPKTREVQPEAQPEVQEPQPEVQEPEVQPEPVEE